MYKANVLVWKKRYSNEMCVFQVTSQTLPKQDRTVVLADVMLRALCILRPA